MSGVRFRGDLHWELPRMHGTFPMRSIGGIERRGVTGQNLEGSASGIQVTGAERALATVQQQLPTSRPERM